MLLNLKKTEERRMKKYLLGLSLLSGMIHANGVVGTVTDAFCGEIDPFAIGDACLVFVKENASGRLYGLHYHDYDFMSVVLEDQSDMSDLVGKEVEAYSCDFFEDSNAIYALKRFNSRAFYYDCYVYDFNVLNGK